MMQKERFATVWVDEDQIAVRFTEQPPRKVLRRLKRRGFWWDIGLRGWMYLVPSHVFHDPPAMMELITTIIAEVEAHGGPVDVKGGFTIFEPDGRKIWWEVRRN